jgi:hypothetical protein
MNKILKTTLIVIAALALAVGSLFAGWWVGNRTQAATTAIAPAAAGWDYSFGPGMMGRGQRSGAQGYSYGGMMSGGYGGMMGGGRRSGAQGYSYGGMMGGGYGGGMMGGGYAPGYAADLEPLTVDQAAQAARKYLSALNLSDLQAAEVMIFDNGAYVRVVEQSTGIGAFELLVDPVTQIAYPEHGPNMMWNLKYGGLNHRGMMGGRGGMMGGYAWSATPADVSAEMTVSAPQALEAAQKFLDAYQPGLTVAEEAEPFYGYYTIDTLKDGKVAGMLSVNGFTGQVFPHTWHGTFIEMSE